MKIEIDAKELTALLDYINGQQEPVGNTQALAEEIRKNLPQNIASKLSRLTNNSFDDYAATHCIKTTSDEHGCSVNVQPCVNWKS